MKKAKVLIVFGTRPEAIKMAPLVKALEKFNTKFDTRVCVTAQHREMLDQVLSAFDISPNYDLNIMGLATGLAELSAEMIRKVTHVLRDYEPDLVIVHGDTSTTLNSALAAFYEKIPVAHVEAGLRTHNLYEPWPEEMNRKLTGGIAKYHFAPTAKARQNLLKENIPHESILVTGNTVIDALKMVTQRLDCDKQFRDKTEKKLKAVDFERKLILVTAHRRENFGQGLNEICTALLSIAQNFPNYQIIFPVHMNPNVKDVVLEKLGEIKNIVLLEPLEYVPFVHLMSKCEFILTDSGGIQEEAPALSKPVLVMRNVTERQEAVDSGAVLLVGTDPKNILENVTSLISDTNLYSKMSNSNSPYGSGDASKKIVNLLISSLEGNKENA